MHDEFEKHPFDASSFYAQLIENGSAVEIPHIEGKYNDVYHFGEYCVIVKKVTNPIGNTNKPSTPEEDFSRRCSAIEIATEELPDYVLPQEIIFFEQEGGEKCLIIKVSNWLVNTTPFSEIPLKELFLDPELCQAIIDISRFARHQLLEAGRYFDLTGGNCDSKAPKILRHLINAIKSSNVFCAKDNYGNKTIFIDTDWYSFSNELKRGNVFIASRNLLWINNILLFSTILGLRGVIGKIAPKKRYQN